MLIRKDLLELIPIKSTLLGKDKKGKLDLSSSKAILENKESIVHLLKGLGEIGDGVKYYGDKKQI